MSRGRLKSPTEVGNKEGVVRKAEAMLGITEDEEAKREAVRLRNGSLYDSEIAVLSDFYPRKSRDAAEGMLRALIAYAGSYFSWKKVIDEGVVCGRTLQRYLQDDVFREKCDKCGHVMAQLAISTYHQAMFEAPWSERIKAADRVLAAYHPEKYDGRVRAEVYKAKVALRGDILGDLRKAAEGNIVDISKKPIEYNDEELKKIEGTVEGGKKDANGSQEQASLDPVFETINKEGGKKDANDGAEQSICEEEFKAIGAEGDEREGVSGGGEGEREEVL